MAYRFTTPPWLLELANGETKTVPTCWQDMDMGTFTRLLAIDASVDTYGYLAAVVGCTRMDIMGLAPAVGSQLLELVSYVTQLPPGLGAWPLPAYVHIPGSPGTQYEERQIPLPRELLAQSFGQAVDLGRALEEMTEDIPSLRREALAIYLLPAYFNCPYDSDKLPQMLEVVDRIKLGEGLPVADFFLLSIGESRANTQSSASLYPSQLQRTKQGTRNLVKLGRPTRWQMLWQVGISSSWGRYLLSRGAKS